MSTMPTVADIALKFFKVFLNFITTVHSSQKFLVVGSSLGSFSSCRLYVPLLIGYGHHRR